MKKIKYFTVMAAALLLGFSSCSNDNDSDGNVISGEPTYVKVSFSMPKKYAPTQAGTPAESAIQTVDVLIYDAVTGYLKNSHSLDIGDFTYDNGTDKWVSTDAMSTTSGSSEIYVGINLPSVMATSSMSTIDALTAVEHAVSWEDIATNDKFTMFSEKQSAINLSPWDGTPATLNAISVNVKRLAAKFTLEKKASFAPSIAGGSISGIDFALGQVNLTTFAAQNVTSLSPFAAKSTHHLNTSGTGTGSGFLSGAPDPLTGDYVAINGSGTPIDDLAAKYAPENTSDNTYPGDLTYISVRAVFTPALWITDAAGATEVPTTPGSTFYAIQLPAGYVYFKNENDATAYCTANGINQGKIKTYTGGYCYYTVFVNQAEDYNVYRNEFYQVTVDDIVALGYPAPGPSTPETPAGVEANIKVSISVLDWDLRPENVTLAP